MPMHFISMLIFLNLLPLSVRFHVVNFNLLHFLQISPLLVLELLQRIFDVFMDYFGSVDEGSIKGNFSTVYQVFK